MPSLVEDDALMGDRETGALAAGDGSIDWLCWPRFDFRGVLRGIAGRHGTWSLADRTAGAEGALGAALP
jgi:GH15 family glucan-1,4-alpha-glucosidase